jgi:hypothetical protein
LIVVINPDDVEAFFRYFKAESAHMINGLLGRSKRTLWCEGYDSPIVLTPARTLIAIAYLYSNPAKDGLECSINRYPGFSSWKMFRSGILTHHWKRVRRPQFAAITPGKNNPRGYIKIASAILAQSDELQTFTLEPNAWMESFGYETPEEQQRINERLISRIRVLEERFEKQRQRQGRRVLGRERLLAQVFDPSYCPRRSGRRMWCLSDKRSLRVKFIKFFKALMQKARAIRERWRIGDVSVSYPPGLHPPSMPKLANSFER